MKMTKILSLALAAVMVMTMAGCTTGQDTKVIATALDTEIPAGVYLYNMLGSYYTAASKVTDKNKDVLSQKIDDQSAATWIENEAKKGIQTYLAVEKEFGRLELTLGEEELASAASTVNDVWEKDGSFYEKNGISRASLEMIVVNSAKANAVYDKYYGEGGEKSADPAEMQKYYEENYARINHILVDKTTKSESGEIIALSGEALQKAKDQANTYFERLKSGEAYETILADFEKAKAEASGSEYAPHEHEDNQFAHDLVITRTQMYYPEAYLTQVFDTKVGEAGLYEENDFYIAFIRKPLNSNPEDYEKRKEQISYIVAGEGFTDELLAIAETIEIQWNDKAAKRYKAKSLKLA